MKGWGERVGSIAEVVVCWRKGRVYLRLWNDGPISGCAEGAVKRGGGNREARGWRPSSVVGGGTDGRGEYGRG